MTDIDHLEDVRSLHLSFSLITMASPLVIIRRGSALLNLAFPTEDIVCVLCNVVTLLSKHSLLLKYFSLLLHIFTSMGKQYLFQGFL